MEEQYNPQAIEIAVAKTWDEQQRFKVKEDFAKEKFFCLSMLPYPSGQLHMGHVRNYSIGDVISRYQMMLGKNVLQPIAWDAFGLPAENAAIKHKVAPANWVKQNIAHMRQQFKRLGFAYDWSREFATSDPSYYRWEQWFFLKLLSKGLVYRKNSMVNWDPVDQTVLANEQVVNGCGWRSGAPVERREIPQWFLKITDYADELLDDLDKLEHWPEQVITMQRNWIGRSEGLNVHFNLADSTESLKIYTTRPDTLYGCTYLAIAVDHPLAQQAAKTNSDIQKFIDDNKNVQVAEAAIAALEKHGIDSGIKAIHPLSGEPIAIWIANYVLMDYGSGAVMAVPGHDQRDFEFAQKYQLPIQQVLVAGNDEACDLNKRAFTGYGKLINSAEFDDLDFDAAYNAIADKLSSAGQAERQTHYRIRDWGVSRQRYWGTPIPIIYCDDCGAVAVPEKDLPVILPEDVEFTGATSPLNSMPEFYETTCPQCGKAARRETDTFDTFMESSWYFVRYACSNADKAMLDDRVKYWAPIDQYVGGIEHAVMHLLYARFFYKLLRDNNLLNSDEPFTRLLTQGMVLKDSAKMSKSKGNVVDPQPLIDKYGADTVRVFMIFAAPPEQSLEWSDSGVDGAYRFLRRLWNFAKKHQDEIKTSCCAIRNNSQIKIDWSEAPEQWRNFRRDMNSLLKKAKYDYERQQFNTVVSGCMKLLNLSEEIAAADAREYEHVKKQIKHKCFSLLLRLLSPIAPHLCQHLWQECAYGDDILTSDWPKVATEALVVDQVQLIVQVNGKLRSKIKVSANADETEIRKIALADDKVKQHTQDKTCRKVIIVPGKLVNIVVG